MTPRRQRRRARRRSAARVVIVAGLVVIVVGILVGGLTQVSRQSQGFDAGSNRSLAEQGAVVAGQSNTTAHQLSRLLSDFPGDKRQRLEADLSALTQEAGTESAAAALATGPAPAGSPATDLAEVFRDRAQAVDEVSAAIDGYLGVSPTPPAGTTADAPSPTTAALLSATDATNRITAAGRLLASSDRLYAKARAALAAGAGHPRLPPSVWVIDPAQWRPGFVAAQVDLMATSPTLAATHSVVVRTVRYEPPLLPTPPGTPAGTAVVSPTSSLGVTAVVANQGSVAEKRAVVRVTLTDAASSTGSTGTRTRTWTGPVPLGSSVSLPTANFDVKPGASYVLTVSVVSPQDQVGALGSTYQATLRVAPGT
jgi:hypothetical protein